MFGKTGFVFSGEDSERLRLILAEDRETKETQRPGHVLYWVGRILSWIFGALLFVILLIFAGMVFYAVLHHYS